LDTWTQETNKLTGRSNRYDWNQRMLLPIFSESPVWLVRPSNRHDSVKAI